MSFIEIALQNLVEAIEANVNETGMIKQQYIADEMEEAKELLSRVRVRVRV